MTLWRVKGLMRLRDEFAARATRWRNSPLAKRYAALSERERRLVMIGIGVLFAAFLHLGVYEPATGYRQAGVDDYLRQQSRLEWMLAHRAQAERQSREQGQRAEGQSLLTLVDSSAKAFGLRLARYQPDSAGGVSVVLEGQPFGAIVRWTERLASEHGIRVAQATVDAQDAPGIVNARFRIR